ncbi:hypothetical protein MMC16_002062 [Acarospora aff. strigata]|nr:hypothetical protein [Acarospora aff. strigata]
MLPPIDPATLRNNPTFEHLYKNLTSSILNQDGSSRAPAPGAATAVPREELEAAQVQVAKARILRDALPRLTHGGDELPMELQEVISIIAAQLNTPLSPEERSLLDDDVAYFLEHITPISRTLSKHLSAQLHALANLAYPQESNLRTKTVSLPHDLTTRRTLLQTSHSTLLSKNLPLATTACAILSTYRALHETIIRVLEQTKYGSVARHTKARAEMLCLVAGSLDLKLRILKSDTLSEIYTPEVQAALSNYKAHLEDTETGLRRREREAKETLRKYEAVHEGDMNVLAARYRGLLKEVEAVKADIGRLGGEV